LKPLDCEASQCQTHSLDTLLLLIGGGGRVTCDEAIFRIVGPIDDAAGLDNRQPGLSIRDPFIKPLPTYSMTKGAVISWAFRRSAETRTACM
jgi:hypothetical protein